MTEAVRWLFEKLGRLFIHGAWGAELGTMAGMVFSGGMGLLGRGRFLACPRTEG